MYKSSGLELESALERLHGNICSFLTGEAHIERSLLVKKHNENLQTHGDFSFPNSLRSWQEYAICNRLSDKDNTTILGVSGKQPKDIIEESKNWRLQVNKVTEDKGRIYLYLERPQAIRVGLSEALINIALLSQRLQDDISMVEIDPSCKLGSDLTSLRTNYLSNVIRNLCALCEVNLPIFVTSKSTNKSEGSHKILCGTVLNAKSGAKETNISADDFIRLRQDEMTLIAQHKYGVRVSNDSKWKEFIAHLGESAAAFELLQSKPSSPVKINFDCSSVGSSKGASFILYNCARLETIIRTYNDNVSEGIYPVLPDFADVDFSLLIQEDEWYLIFNYILGLPPLLKNCVDLNGPCDFRPHHICSFLCAMVRVFSQYYRKIRILLEPRKHLLPVIFARMHMLKILNDTLKTCLNILNIKSVSQM